MYFDATVILLIVLIMVTCMDSATETKEDEAEWERIFGHLSKEVLQSKDNNGPNKQTTANQLPNRASNPATPPTPPPFPPPLDLNSESGHNLVATSHGGMEAIAIAQNKSTSVGMRVVNSNYNTINTVLGHSNITRPHSHSRRPAPDKNKPK